MQIGSVGILDLYLRIRFGECYQVNWFMGMLPACSVWQELGSQEVYGNAMSKFN
jgi:hypothetical protein